MEIRKKNTNTKTQMSNQDEVKTPEPRSPNQKYLT